MDQLMKDLARIAAFRSDIRKFLAEQITEELTDEAMAMIDKFAAMAHADGAEFGAARERAAQQLRGGN